MLIKVVLCSVVREKVGGFAFQELSFLLSRNNQQTKSMFVLLQQDCVHAQCDISVSEAVSKTAVINNNLNSQPSRYQLRKEKGVNDQTKELLERGLVRQKYVKVLKFSHWCFALKRRSKLLKPEGAFQRT